MSTIKTKNIKQTVISGTTQPLKIGGILEDGSDAKISIDTSGNTYLSQVTGIKFPATQNPSADANTLDDYEEGTFTPIIVGGTVQGVATYIYQAGQYTKIGNVVNFSLSLNYTGFSGTGTVNIAGLPFATANIINNQYACTTLLDNYTLSANCIGIGYMVQASTTIKLTQMVVGTNLFSNAPIDTSAIIIMSGFYHTA